MKEKFTENFGNSASAGGENANFDVHQIYKGFPSGLPEGMIETQGLQIESSFLGEESSEPICAEKNEKEIIFEQAVDEIMIKAYEYIDLNDLKASYTKIIQELQRKNLYIADDLEMNRHIEITFGLVVNNIQNEERKFLKNKLNGGKGSFSRKERGEAYDYFERMAINDAEWMHKIQQYIIENRENPEIIKAFWKDFDNYYSILKKKYGNILDDDRNPERIKHGILAEIAAKSLIEDLQEVIKKENIPGWDTIRLEISDSTGDQDVYEKTDFNLVLNGEIIPCQVKSCVIRPEEISDGSVEKEASRRKKYAEENFFTIVKADSYFKETELNSGPWQERNIDKMIQFRNLAVRGKHVKGCYFLFPVDKENGEDLLREDGIVSERIRKKFLKEIVKKFFEVDIYPDLDEKKKNNSKKNRLYKF